MKIERNSPCPCGSGKKFKRCHLGKEEEIQFNDQQAPIIVSKDDCFYRLATRKRDFSLCQKIESLSIKDTCWEFLERRTRPHFSV